MSDQTTAQNISYVIFDASKADPAQPESPLPFTFLPEQLDVGEPEPLRYVLATTNTPQSYGKDCDPELAIFNGDGRVFSKWARDGEPLGDAPPPGFSTALLNPFTAVLDDADTEKGVYSFSVEVHYKGERYCSDPIVVNKGKPPE